jgi:phospholipid/cholesterol/gamma-HCH transport system permease protein
MFVLPSRPSIPQDAIIPIVNVLLNALAYLGGLIRLFGEGIRAARYLHRGDFVRQLSIIGAESIPVAALIVGFSGAVLSYYSVANFASFGAQGLAGGIVALSILKETGPIFAGLAIASRAGTRMAAEIGTMKVTEQIDALRAMAISPVEYLVTPRLLAALIGLPLATVFADTAGLLGGCWMAMAQGLPSAEFWNSVQAYLRTDGWDALGGLLKSVVYGAIIATVGCYEGLQAGGGANGVGKATTRSIVIAIVLMCAADLILTPVIFPR